MNSFENTSARVLSDALTSQTNGNTKTTVARTSAPMYRIRETRRFELLARSSVRVRTAGAAVAAAATVVGRRRAAHPLLEGHRLSPA